MGADTVEEDTMSGLMFADNLVAISETPKACSN